MAKHAARVPREVSRIMRSNVTDSTAFTRPRHISHYYRAYGISSSSSPSPSPLWSSISPAITAFLNKFSEEVSKHQSSDTWAARWFCFRIEKIIFARVSTTTIDNAHGTVGERNTATNGNVTMNYLKRVARDSKRWEIYWLFYNGLCFAQRRPILWIFRTALLYFKLHKSWTFNHVRWTFQIFIFHLINAPVRK